MWFHDKILENGLLHRTDAVSCPNPLKRLITPTDPLGAAAATPIHRLARNRMIGVQKNRPTGPEKYLVESPGW